MVVGLNVFLPLLTASRAYSTWKTCPSGLRGGGFSQYISFEERARQFVTQQCAYLNTKGQCQYTMFLIREMMSGGAYLKELCRSLKPCYMCLCLYLWNDHGRAAAMK